MKRTFKYAALFIGLLLLGVFVAGSLLFAVKRNASTVTKLGSITVQPIIWAHNGRSGASTTFSQKATLRYYTGFPSASANQFERKLTLVNDGSVIRYDRFKSDTSERYVLDGDTLIKTTSHSGAILEEKAITGVEADSIRFQMATWGLLPILKRILDPKAEVFALGPSIQGDRFEVKTAAGQWFFYVNSKHLIDRVEIGNININYGDYRNIDGSTLPFYQKVKKGEATLYEIEFDSLAGC